MKILFILNLKEENIAYIGKYLNKEIDFIGIRCDENIYVQVCNIIPKSSKGNENGIEIMYVGNFLLKENY